MAQENTKHKRKKMTGKVVIDDRTGMGKFVSDEKWTRQDWLDQIKGDNSREATIIRRSLTPESSPWRNTPKNAPWRKKAE